MRRTTIRTMATVSGAALALCVVAACGDDGDDSSAGDATTAQPADERAEGETSSPSP